LCEVAGAFSDVPPAAAAQNGGTATASFEAEPMGAPAAPTLLRE
jgi:hypothetical protein